MRKLRIVVRSSKGALPIIVAASVVSASACGDAEGGSDNTHATGDASMDASGGAGAGGTNAGGASGSGMSGSGGISGSGQAGTLVIPDTGPMECPSYATNHSFDVAVPPEGTPAEPGQICAATIEPVESGRAARVTLSGYSNGSMTVDGFVEIDPALVDRIVGTPIVEVLDATSTEALALVVTGIVREGLGFRFQGTWPAPVYFPVDGMTRITMRVSLELDCGADAATRVVHSATDVHLCQGETDAEWVSSGDRCIVCEVIAEMAPSPIVPGPTADDLPLSRVMRLRVVELARVSNTIVLLAENDGGEGLQYEWHPSDGSIERLAPDVIAWTLAEGMRAPQIQVAVIGAEAAAVASFSFNEAA